MSERNLQISNIEDVCLKLSVGAYLQILLIGDSKALAQNLGYMIAITAPSEPLIRKFHKIARTI
jgi:hypothetical protein